MQEQVIGNGYLQMIPRRLGLSFLNAQWVVKKMARQIWRFLDLGALEPVASQAVYEAVAEARSRGIVPDTLIICWPKSPLICVGYFQEVDKELDVKYCEAKSVPVVRRILGGGAVYLDSNQVFYQIIGERGGNVIPKDIEAIFQKVLEAPIRLYKEIGIPVVYKPVNDIEVEGRKISGNGAGGTNGIAILTGNIILDFNYDEMTKILKVPDEKFRDKLAKSLRERVTSVKRELGSAPPNEVVKTSLVKHFGETLGVEFVARPLLREEERLLGNLISEKYLSKKWTYENSSRHKALSRSRIVKVSGRSTVGQGMYKSVGGLIRVTAEFTDNKISDILISGDFTFLPPKIPELEKALLHVDLDERTLIAKIDEFYIQHEIASPGTNSSDFTKAIMLAGGVQGSR